MRYIIALGLLLSLAAALPGGETNGSSGTYHIPDNLKKKENVPVVIMEKGLAKKQTKFAELLQKERKSIVVEIEIRNKINVTPAVVEKTIHDAMRECNSYHQISKSAWFVIGFSAQAASALAAVLKDAGNFQGLILINGKAGENDFPKDIKAAKNIPVLMIYGTEDPVCTAEKARPLEFALKKNGLSVKFKTVETSDHMKPITDGIRYIVEFMDAHCRNAPVRNMSGSGKKKKPKEWKPKRGGSKKKPKNWKDAQKLAIDYLAKTQTKEGYFGNVRARFLEREIVMTAFGGLALLANGSTPTDGPHSENINRAVKWMLEWIMYENPATRRPYPGGGSMRKDNWTFSIGGLFLLEVYAVTKDKKIKEVLEKIIPILEKNMESSGGYGHGEVGKPCEHGYIEMICLSNWVMSFLGATKKAKFKVNKSVLKRGCQYIIDCVAPSGGLYYSHKQKGSHFVGRTGLGITALFINGLGKNSLCRKMINFLDKHMSEMAYGHSSTAMHYVSGALGSIFVSKKLWDKYVKAHFPQIIRHQNPDGSFKAIDNAKEGEYDTKYGIAYSSTFYTFILSLDLGNLNYLGGVHSK